MAGESDLGGQGAQARPQMLSDAIVRDYTPDLKSAFLSLNLEWIQKYFSVESEDLSILGDPQGSIIGCGGHILFALLDGEPVGTVALLKRGERVYELAKMAVSPKAQGMGIGRNLIAAAIERARSTGARTIYLETNDRLTAAVNLYRSVGFVRDQAPPHSKYARVNVTMTLNLEG
jgi:GNAT superfamily N-acetyltransferase